ncbi:MAG: hypothetical protein KUG68_00390 [Flavobacteriaceae bacterium]|nr:hypothetical protein [Flavobacteriaceae bacterium]
MKKLLTIFAFLLLISCSNYGEKVSYNGTDIYYKEGVTIEQANNLGKHLVKSEFADGAEKSVQLVKDETTGNLTFRMVVSSGNEEGNDMIFKLFAKQLSDEVFEGKPVDFQLCDNMFKTLKTYSFNELDQKISVNGTEIVFTKNVNKTEVQQLGDYLKESEFTDGTPKTIQLDKEDGTYLFKMVVAKGAEKVATNIEILKAFGVELSENVFSGNPVKVHMCDNELRTIHVIE